MQHRDTLYVFGGELSFCNDQETPLWLYHIQVISWQLNELVIIVVLALIVLIGVDLVLVVFI